MQWLYELDPLTAMVCFAAMALMLSLGVMVRRIWCVCRHPWVITGEKEKPWCLVCQRRR